MLTAWPSISVGDAELVGVLWRRVAPAEVADRAVDALELEFTEGHGRASLRPERGASHIE
jgi:hypothetical protein